MFYDIFLQLCKKNGTKPTPVAEAIGVNRSTATKWKKGAIPSGDTLQKLADYFGVSVDYLLNEETKKSPAEAEDDEINEYLEELKNNPGMRILFSKTKGATKEELEKVVKMIEIMRGDSF